MNHQEQQQISAALEATCADAVLSNQEEAKLRQTIEGYAGEREALAFIRNRAFRLARERIEQYPLAILRWLERIDKIIDNTASPPAPGGARGRGKTACAFSPGEHGLELIRNTIRAARQSLDICVFTITDDRLTSAILDRHHGGVAVRLVTDNDKQFDSGSDIARLESAGVPTRFDPDTDHMHHKFAIVDARCLINGSYNWTRGATRNHENIITLYDPDLIKAFAAEFDRLWKAFKTRR